MRAELKVEILAYAPTAFFQCRHCEVVMGGSDLGRRIRQEQLASGLPPDLSEEYARVSGWALEQLARHRDRIAIEVIDAASLRGFWKSLRHRVRRYPAVIVAGESFAGSALEVATAALARRLPA